MSNSLPNGWESAELGSLGSIITGKTPSTKDPNNFGGEIPFVKPGDLDSGGQVFATADTLTEKGFSSVPSLPKNAVMVTCIGNLGKVGITAQPSATNQQINSVVPFPGIDHKYLYHYIGSMRDWLERESSATTVSIINKGKFSKMPVLIPAEAEQKQIAAKLDELLAQVDSIKTRLDAIPAILKRFRQSVLAAAVSGRLTEDWRAGKKFDTQKKPLSEVISSAQVGLVRSSKEQFECSEAKTPYLKMNNIDNEWGLDLMAVVCVNADHAELEKYQLKDGDWLFNTRNSYELVGKSCVWHGDKGVVYNNNILRVRLKDGYLSDYLDIWARSPDGIAGLSQIKSATTNVAAIYQKQLITTKIPFPSIDEQGEIIRRVHRILLNMEDILKVVEKSASKCSRLSQAVLGKGFRGDLTSGWREQNAELISAENSAEALLQRIKTEQAKLEPVKRFRKKKPAGK